jgi:thymidine kinase
MSKYRNAKELIKGMIGTVDTIDCEEILRKRKDWALNENEFNAKEEFEKVLNSNQNKDSFLYSIITFLFNELIEKKKSINEEKNSLFSCETSDESGQSPQKS